MATCDFCGASSAALLACARCQLVSYCDKGCQVKHWKEGGHKERCRNKNKMLDAVAHLVQKDAKIRDAAAMKSLLKGYSITLVAKVSNDTLACSPPLSALNQMLEDIYGVCLALHAAQSGHVAVLELLRNAKANLDTQNTNGDTPANLAAGTGDVAVFKILRDAKSNLENQNMFGATPALIAAQKGHVAVLKFLRDSNVNLEIPNKDGVTPAAVAAECCHVAVLELLRNARANLETPNKEGFTPTHMAAKNGHVAVLELLRDANVSLETPNKDSRGFSKLRKIVQGSGG